MSSINLKVKRVHPDALVPTRAYEGDAGLDIYAYAPAEWDPHSGYWEYLTGIAVEIPLGHVGLIFPRSSISTKALSLSNAVGVIDSSFRGEIKFRFRNVSDSQAYIYCKGDRIGQLIVMPYPQVNLQIVDDLTPSDRGTGGYGSSGK